MPDTDPILDLRRYTVDLVHRAAGRVRQRAAGGLLGQIDLALAMAQFRFRDLEGCPWFLDAYGGQWYRHDGCDWQGAGAPPAVLEGADGLPTPAGEFDLALESADRPGAEAEMTRAGAAALAESVALVRVAYEAGELSSLEAHALLARWFLVDRCGTFWGVGVHSGRWYRFAEDAWQQAGGPPDSQSLVRLHPSAGPCPICGQPAEGQRSCAHCGTALPGDLSGLSDQAYGAVARFVLEHAGSLPEPVASPWTPPAGYPNAEVPRVTRQAPASGSEATPGPGGGSPPDGGRLRWTKGPNAGQHILLGERVRLGRGPDNEVCIESPGVSRHHAVIEWAGGGYQIADLGSANGTRVNGRPISGPTPLRNGDQVTMQDVQFLVVAPSLSAIACPACGSSLSTGAKFCGQCGARVGG
jgi:hypothetical protein